MTNQERWMGPGEKSYEYFIEMNDRGLADLKKKRDEINRDKGDGSRRAERTWGVIQAAEMIDRSPQWVRDKDPNPPRNEAGHGRWTLSRIIELMDLAGTRYHRPEGSRALVLAMSKFKGGVGNTTNTLHIAHGLAMKGLKVLIWDWDAQASATQDAGGVIPDLELEDEDLPLYVMEKDPDAILDPSCSVVRGTYFHNVHLVPANSALNELEHKLVNQYLGNNKNSTTDVRPELRMNAVLNHIKDNYDVILIDCPPALGINTMNGLLASDGIITSVKPELFDRASLVAYMDALGGLCGDQGKDFRYFRVLISQYHDGITKDHKGQDKETGHRANEIALRTLYGDAVMQNMMHHSREIGHASSELSTVLASEKAIGSRTTYNRAIGIVKSVVDEIFEDLKQLWEMERDDE